MSLDELDSHLSCSFPRELGGLDGSRTTGVVERHYPPELRNNLFQDFQALRGEVSGPVVDARESTPRICKAIYEPDNNGIGPGTKNDGDFCGRPPCCYGA